MQSKSIEKYFFFGLLSATLIFTFLIFRPFWVILVLGASFAIVLYPFHAWLNRKRSPSWLSALITVALFTIILCGPILGIGAIVFNQSQDVYHRVVNNGNPEPLMTSINAKVNRVLPPIIAFDVNEKVRSFVAYTSSNIANIFTSAFSAFFSFILMLLIIFYALKDGAEFKEALIKFSPLGKENDEKIIHRLTEAINGVVTGSLLIALIQGVLLGFGLWLFHIPNAALWGVVAAVMSLIPTVGTALISVPAIVFLFLKGDTVSAVSLLIWSVVVVGMIDNFLAPLLVAKKVKIPSIFILFSVLGGITVLGPVGILVGPLTLSLLFALISIYKNEFTQA